MTQTIIVILLFALALGYLLRKYLFKSNEAPGCSKGCNSCAESQPKQMP